MDAEAICSVKGVIMMDAGASAIDNNSYGGENGKNCAKDEKWGGI